MKNIFNTLNSKLFLLFLLVFLSGKTQAQYNENDYASYAEMVMDMFNNTTGDSTWTPGEDGMWYNTTNGESTDNIEGSWTDESGFEMYGDGRGRIYADFNNNGVFEPSEVIDHTSDGSGSGNGNDPDYNTPTYSELDLYNPYEEFFDQFNHENDNDEFQDLIDYLDLQTEIIYNSSTISDEEQYENAINSFSNGDYRIVQGTILIKSDQGNFVLLSSADTNSATVTLRAKKLIAILAKSLGAFGKGVVIHDAPAEKTSDVNPAGTRRISATEIGIFFNTNGGFSKSIDNIYNLKSVIKHEIFHVDNLFNDQLFKNNLSNHADVYIKAAKDPTFLNTTEEFKLYVTGSFANYLLNMAKANVYTLNEIVSKVNLYNQNNGGIQILVPAGPFGKDNFSLRIKFNNVISEPIPYSLIDEKIN